MDRVLSLLGLADLIAEALICTTMGTTFSLERINQAIDLGFSIKDFVEDYGSPELPRPMLIMPDMPSISISFSITGDPPLWKQIRDIILQTLAEVAFDIIKGIAELIKHNCDNLLNRPENEGEIDLASAVTNNPVGGMAGNALDPASQDLVDEAFAAHGFDQETGYAYLSEIGGRLTPLEVCRLFHSPDAVSDETIEKIRLHNLDSDSEAGSAGPASAAAAASCSALYIASPIFIADCDNDSNLDLINSLSSESITSRRAVISAST